MNATTIEAIAESANVHRTVLPRVAVSDGRSGSLRPVRDGACVPAPRPPFLTPYGKVLLAVTWLVIVWHLAEVAPFWWTRL